MARDLPPALKSSPRGRASGTLNRVFCAEKVRGTAVDRECGRFVRRFALPTEVDAAKVQAEFKDGVLNVHLPKSAKATPKSIEVKVA